MSKFNQVAKDPSITINKEGAKAWELTPEMALYTRVCTTFLVDQFYTPNFNSELDRIRDLIKKVDPMFVAQLAIYARSEMNMRSIPLVLAVELAKIHKGDSLVRRMVYRIIQRADELTEIMAYYVSANIRDGENAKNVAGNKKSLYALSKQLSKGIADAFSKFDEYQMKKYESNNKNIKLKDVLFLTHPKPANKEQKELFNKIANSTLSQASTWENASSNMGQKVAQQAKKANFLDAEREALKNEAAKKMWEDKIDTEGKDEIGYMALLRNLMNFLKYNISLDHIKKVAAKLSDADRVHKSKQLPFRFVAAYRMIRYQDTELSRGGYGVQNNYPNLSDQYNRNNGIYELNDFKISQQAFVIQNPKVGIILEALEEAVKHACINIPSFDWDTKVLLAADTSSSMMQKISSKSMLECYDIGLALSMMLQYKCKIVSAGMFGDSFVVLPLPKDQILRNIDDMRNCEGMVGYSTNGYLVIDYAIQVAKNGTIFDKVFMFSDGQLWNSKSYGHNNDMNHIDSKWKEFKKIAPNAKLYIFDLAGYGTSPINLRQNDVYMVAGWSDKIFDVLKAIDEGGDVLDKIKRIEV